MNLSPSSVIITFTRTTATINMTVNSTDRPPYLNFLFLNGFLRGLPFLPSFFTAGAVSVLFSAAVSFTSAAVSFTSAASFILLMRFLLYPFIIVIAYAQRRFSSTLTVRNRKIKITLTKNIRLDRLNIPLVISEYLEYTEMLESTSCKNPLGSAL